MMRQQRQFFPVVSIHQYKGDHQPEQYRLSLDRRYRCPCCLHFEPMIHRTYKIRHREFH
ncbi:hypothetical protein YDC107_5138 (plasmid) [Escherichia coli]|nr:hypothetical protein YDC107_5138 [Escherichia coli]